MKFCSGISKFQNKLKSARFFVMAFMNEIYHFKKIFRDIEKATKKCVHLNGTIEYIYIYTYIYNGILVVGEFDSLIVSPELCGIKLW